MAADDLKTLIQRAALDPDDKTALDELARALHRAGYGRESELDLVGLVVPVFRTLKGADMLTTFRVGTIEEP